MQFKDYLVEQLTRHPSMQPADIIKMCYQAAFGAEHLLSDPERARAYLTREYEAALASERSLYEQISDHVCRVDLSAWKGRGYPIEWLFRMFSASCRPRCGGARLFFEYLETAKRELPCLPVRFSMSEWDAFLVDYQSAGMPPVHHSEQYRAAESPAYRIVNSVFAEILPLLDSVTGTSPYTVHADPALSLRAAELTEALQITLAGDVNIIFGS